MSTFSEQLSSLIGDEGIKTDLRVDVPQHVYWNMGITIVGSIVVGGLLYKVISKIVTGE